jgi:hypothetical protein
MSQKKRSLFWLTIAAGLVFVGAVTTIRTIVGVVGYRLHVVGQPVWWNDEDELKLPGSQSYRGSSGVRRDTPSERSIFLLVG